MAGRDLFADEPLPDAPVAASKGRDLFADEPLPSAPTRANAPQVESKLKLPEYSRPLEAVRSGLRGLTVGTSDVLGAGAAALATPSPNQDITDPEAWKAAYNQLGTAYKDIKGNLAGTRDAYRAEHPVESAAAEIGGAVLPAIATLGASAPASGGALLPAMGRGAAMGATQGAVYGGSQADVGSELQGAGQGALFGGLVGGALPAAGRAIKSVIMPNAAQNPSLQKVLAEGGTPTIGMALGGRVNALEEKLTSLPLMGDMISVARNKAVQSLEPAAYNRALSPVGEKLPKGITGRDALVHTENALKGKYDDVLNKIGAIIPDQDFSAKTQSLAKMVEDLKMPEAQKAKFTYAIDKINSSLNKDGVMTSDAYKKLESSLGSQAKKLYGSQDIYEADMAPAVKQLQVELRDMLERQAGSHAKDLQKVNEGWANFKVLQKAASGVGAEEGRFTPTQLQSAVRAADKSKDKAQFARGNALMQDLSEAGKTVMGSKVGNSFTADRAFMGLGALASGGINPAIPAALAAGGAAYTQPAQKALVALVAKRPDLANKLISNGATNEAIMQAAQKAGIIAANQDNQ